MSKRRPLLAPQSSQEEPPPTKLGTQSPPGRPVPPPSLTLLSSPDEPFIHVQDSVLVLLCSRLQYIHFLFLENATLTLKNPAQMPFFSKLSHFLPLGSHASSFIPRIQLFPHSVVIIDCFSGLPTLAGLCTCISLNTAWCMVGVQY